MKKLTYVLFLFIFPISVFSQKLSEASTIEQAFDIAKKRNKPVLLIVKLPANPNSKAAQYEIKDATVIQKMKENFVVFETLRTNNEIRPILATFKITSFPSFLFMHGKDDLFFKDYGYSSANNKYFTMLDKAIALSKNKSIAMYEASYLADKTNMQTLKEYIDAKIKNGLKDNADLIETYVQNLKLSDLNDYQTVLFILQAGPYSDGTALKMAYTNRKIIDSIYKSEPIQLRSEINRAIIDNTMMSAIKSKNIARAQAAANTARSSAQSNYPRSYQMYNHTMLRYYKAVKDTSNYLKNAVGYYDQTFMTISADSVKKLEEKYRKNLSESNRQKLFGDKKFVSKEKIDSLISAGGKITKSKEFSMISSSVSPTNYYANSLNYGAWEFYRTGTTNINYLTKAMIWSRRSIELNPSPINYHTLAHLLYKMNYQAEAIKTQEEAIAIAKTKKMGTKAFEDSLKKMKNKTL
ncbi:hypothetical protein [Pedobacter xixiisoli]|uniref:Tetratricopeptide repeat-containing protein n=1 Tax=Pedobacter xixiisoli TaxID=1476464 RepID=A0A286AA33_9SPHI|nr:hypothetical protein [Pedobacter xixiisoli]SOD18732.1 hypothetical protein SAMN06297358_3157 [Pedobacter xixiisoli]